MYNRNLTKEQKIEVCCLLNNFKINNNYVS